LETLAHDQPDREHVRHGTAQDDPIEGLSLQQDRARHAVPVGRSRAGNWRRLRGYNQLPKVIQGAKFADGIEVVRSQVSSCRLIPPVTEIRR